MSRGDFGGLELLQGAAPRHTKVRKELSVYYDEKFMLYTVKSRAYKFFKEKK